MLPLLISTSQYVFETTKSRCLRRPMSPHEASSRVIGTAAEALPPALLQFSYAAPTYLSSSYPDTQSHV